LGVLLFGKLAMNIEPGFSRESIDLPEQSDEEIRRRRKRWMIIGGVIAAVLLVLFLAFRGDKPAAPQETAPRVTVILPSKQSVDRVISVTGTLAARREMPVGVAGDGGMVNRVLVEAGDWVDAGQALATIDTSVQSQQANQLRSQIAAARAQAELADSQLKRAQALVSRGFVSQADVEQKKATRDAARAQVGVAQAQLGEIQARIAQMAIRAPAAGLVLTRDVEPGQVVGSGSGALFRMAKGGEMELRANLSESDVSVLAVNNSADVTPVGSSRRFAGKIWQLSPIVDLKSRQGGARIALAYDPALRPGGFASADIKTGTTMAPLLPESAVLSDPKGSFVYVVVPDNKVVRRDVKVGVVTNTGLPIISGLQGTEKVVESAGAFLSPGDKVIPVLDSKRQ